MVLLMTAELDESKRWNRPLQALPSRSSKYRYSFASFHPNARWKSNSFLTASQLPSSTSHCPALPENAKSRYLSTSFRVGTSCSTRLSTPLGVSTPWPRNRTLRDPSSSLPMNQTRTRCEARHHVVRSNQTPVVDPRHTALSDCLSSHFGSHGSWSQYCSSGVRRMSEWIDIFANENSGRRRLGRAPGHAVKPANTRGSGFVR